MNIDSARTVQIHATLIQKNLFLKKVYESFYRRMQKRLPKNGIVVELGSGGGFIKEIIPHIITSDVIRGKGIDKVFSAEKIPFRNTSVDAFVMLNVLHHIKDVKGALSEMQRCLKTDGKIVMIEPWNTPLSKYIYQHFHHELFDPRGNWKIKERGRLSAANGALPWILFHRDISIYRKTFPNLRIKTITPHTPLLYILSGGLSRPSLFPLWAFPLFTFLELISAPLFPFIALFATIEIRKIR